MPNIIPIVILFYQQLPLMYSENILEPILLSPQQTRVARNIMSCRTAVLGGHASLYEECGHLAIRYNSCRNLLFTSYLISRFALSSTYSYCGIGWWINKQKSIRQQ